MKEVFTTTEASRVCHISKQKIVNLFDDGKIGGFRIPGAKGAKARARRELKELMARYDSLPSTSSLHVKAGFDTTDEHTEHMWVAIQGVNGDNLVGTLLNSPFNGNRYRKGQSITFQLEAVSDFIYTREDGSTQGNYTEPFLR